MKLLCGSLCGAMCSGLLDANQFVLLWEKACWSSVALPSCVSGLPWVLGGWAFLSFSVRTFAEAHLMGLLVGGLLQALLCCASAPYKLAVSSDGRTWQGLCATMWAS